MDLADSSTPRWHTPQVLAWFGRGGWPLAVLATAMGGALGLVILHYGDIQFGGEDGGIVASVAWQMHLGYKPYTDMAVTGLPPMLLWGANWAFAIFGVSWHSLVAVTAIFCVVTFVALVMMADRLGLGVVPSLLFALTTQAVTVVPISFWWANQITAVTGCLFVTAVLLFLRSPNNRIEGGILMVTAIMLFMAKADLAGLLTVSALCVVVASPRTRRRGLGLMGSAALAATGLLVWNGIDLSAMVSSYLVGGTRLMSGNFLNYLWDFDNDEVRRTFSALVPAVAAGFVMLASVRIDRRPSNGGDAQGPWKGMAAAAMTSGVVVMATTNDHNMISTPLILIGLLAFALVVVPRMHRRLLQVTVLSLLTLSSVALSVEGLTFAVDRQRIRAMGYGLFFEDTQAPVVQTPSFLAGVRSGPVLQWTMDEIRILLDLNGYEGDPMAPVGFGPRLQFAYPAFGLYPRKGIPVWWQMYPDGAKRTDDAVHRFQAADYDVIVFMTGEYTYLPDGLIQYLNRDFDVYAKGDLTLHVSKRARGEFSVPQGYTLHSLADGRESVT